MRGYDEASYGDGMADVYDDWYAAPPDTDACIAALAALAPQGRVLELGAGTGRLAIPLAQRGLEMHALDGSAEMLRRLAAKPGGERVTCHVGDMATDLPPGPFDLVFVAVNTFFGILEPAAQAGAMLGIAERLRTGGYFVIEAFVPEQDADGDRIDVRDLSADRVVLSISRTDAAKQQAMGQFVELRDGMPVRLRPWAIRWALPEELDVMASASGLALESRWSSWAGAPFTAESSNHVSVYRKPS